MLSKQKLLLHVGYAKSGSTSLQSALLTAENVYYPKSGRLADNEHLSLALKLKGVDDWTSQYVDQDWVEREHASMLQEIAGVNRPIALSSERLMDLTADQKRLCKAIFSGFDIEVVALTRSKENWLKSTWRHAVYWHDFAVPWEAFADANRDFDMAVAPNAFRSLFQVHEVCIEQENWIEQLECIYGTKLDIAQENLGIAFSAANFLQKLHVELGTKKYREYFTTERKKDFASLFQVEEDPTVETFDVPLF